MATLKNIFKATGGVVKETAKVAYKTTMAVGEPSAKVIDAIGNAALHGSKKAAIGTKNVATKTFLRELTEKEAAELTPLSKLVPKRLNKKGIAALTAGTMAVSTVGAIKDNSSKLNNLGYVSTSDNLDRLISYDGSGFLQNFNQVSQGDPEVMKDIVKHTFDNVNQYGASGDLVFALHNMREG